MDNIGRREFETHIIEITKKGTKGSLFIQKSTAPRRKNRGTKYV